jgi:cbb3-type cytochrome oxidase maturation protein
MSVIYLLIIISICIALCFLGAFLWAVKHGQFEDDMGPSVRILLDDQPALNQSQSIGKTTPSTNNNNVNNES